MYSGNQKSLFLGINKNRFIQMLVRKPLLIIGLGLTMLSMSFSSFAQIENPEFDILFNAADQTDINDPSFPQMVKDLESLLDVADIERTYLLLPKQCLSHNVFHGEQNKLADQFIIDAIKTYPAMPASTRIELKLCEATIMRYRGDTSAANALIRESLLAAEGINNRRLMADAYSQLGQIASYTADFAMALKNLMLAHELYKEFDLPTRQRLSLLDLAVTYRRMGETDTALKYYLQLEKAFTKSNQLDLVMLVKMDMAYAYEDLRQYQKAADYYLTILNYFQDIYTDPTYPARVAVDMSYPLIELGKYQQALDYLKEYEDVIGPNVDTHYSFMQLFFAQAKHGLGLTEQAIPYLNKATAGFKRNHNKRGHEMLLNAKVDIYESLQDWQQAYDAQISLYEIHQLIDKAMENQSSTEMLVKFDSEKIEAENAELIAFQLLKEQQLATQQDNERLQYIALMLAGASLILLFIFTLYSNKKSKQFKLLALTDLLTQLPNRLALYQQANQLFNNALIKQQTLAIVSFDVDHFKQVNDTYGHDAGDTVLKTLARICTNKLPANAVIGRVGGEEFLVLLPQIRSTAAISLTQAIIEHVSSHDFSAINSELKVTISAGVSTYYDEQTLSELIKKSDMALYQAKRNGRNQLSYYHDDSQRL
ncbi:tetratricopeptide repeat-containing diguanylate cyclase [Shewanella sp. UCD-KL21]|uniref:tetratricopeptide repeat-containing diguanylate cyclase n=1 Tax=Shewanella sp. UCD-KL21 TaxID=1917164 RepID=UPI0009706FC3|nr:tetratricopeptide repeat-containing diguanylate cyclase [Shewanella sp. UCD-KL21]